MPNQRHKDKKLVALWVHKPVIKTWKARAAKEGKNMTEWITALANQQVTAPLPV